MAEQKDNEAKPAGRESALTHRSKIILEASIDGFCVIGLDGRILEVNSSICNILGYSKKELLKMKITDVEAFETAEETAQHIEKVIKQGHDRFETKHRRKNGTIVDVEVSVQYCDFGKDRFFFSFLRDISKRRQAEQQYKTIFQNAVEGIVIAEIETKKLKYVNPAACKLLGYSQKELEQMSITDIHPKEHLEQVLATFEMQVRGEKSLATDIPCLRKDGTIIYANINASKTTIDRKEYLVGFFSDITECKRIEQALKKSKEQYMLIVENAQQIIATIDINGTYLFMNAFAAEQLGGKAADFIGKSLWDVFPKEYADRHIKKIRTAVESGESVTTQEIQTMVAGKICWYDVLIWPRNNNSATVVATDITSRKEFEAEREIYKEQLFRAHKYAYIDSMGTIVAHQLNQPLTVINMLLGRALEMEQGQEKNYPLVFKSIRESLAEAQKAAWIIRKFRRSSKTPVLETVKKVNISTVANRIVSVLNEKAEQVKMAISIENLENIPDVNFNETALEQIFLIIMQNAIEAAEDSKQHKLSITGKFAGKNIELEFSDDCGGIATENIDKIFEPFFSTKAGKGLGLGLEIVQHLLTGIGGKIRVKNRLGRGTTFHVTLPVNDN